MALSNKVAARTTRIQRRIMCACGKQKKTLNDYVRVQASEQESLRTELDAGHFFWTRPVFIPS